MKTTLEKFKFSCDVIRSLIQYMNAIKYKSELNLLMLNTHVEKLKYYIDTLQDKDLNYLSYLMFEYSKINKLIILFRG